MDNYEELIRQLDEADIFGESEREMEDYEEPCCVGGSPDRWEMTLDEAIFHAEEKAEQLCGQCAEEHAQLAEWLKELKKLKGQSTTKVKPIRHERMKKLEPCPFCGGEAVIRVLMGNEYISPIHKKGCLIKPNTWLQSSNPIKVQIKAWNRRAK